MKTEEPAWIEADAPLLPRALKRTFTLPANLWRHRALWLAGARRELKARVTGSVFGWLWPVVQPLLLFFVYSMLARMLGMRFPDDYPGLDPMGLYLFVGVVVWSAFAEGCSRGTTVFTERGELLKRASFPAEVLPFQAILAQQCLMLIGFCAPVLALFLEYFAMLLGLGDFGGLFPLLPQPGWALVPLLLVVQALFTLGLCLATATLHALLRDTAHLIALLTTLWMFATPIFWIPSAEVVPGVAELLPWLEWNPMHAFVSCWRWALMGAHPEEAFTASLSVSLGRAVLWTAGALLVGGFVFAMGERRLPDEV